MDERQWTFEPAQQLHGYFLPCEWPLAKCGDKAWYCVRALGKKYLLCLAHIKAEAMGEMGCM